MSYNFKKSNIIFQLKCDKIAQGTIMLPDQSPRQYDFGSHTVHTSFPGSKTLTAIQYTPFSYAVMTSVIQYIPVSQAVMT